MIEEEAIVIAREGEFAWVEAQRGSTCGACSLNKGCGTSALARMLGNRAARTRALNSAAAEVGDRVVVGLDEGVLLQGSLALYLVPLVSMVGFAIFGEFLASQWLISGEAWTIALGLVGLAAGGLWVRGFTRRVSRDPRYQPVVLRRQSAPAAVPVRIHDVPRRVS